MRLLMIRGYVLNVSRVASNVTVILIQANTFASVVIMVTFRTKLLKNALVWIHSKNAKKVNNFMLTKKDRVPAFLAHP